MPQPPCKDMPPPDVVDGTLYSPSPWWSGPTSRIQQLLQALTQECEVLQQYEDATTIQNRHLKRIVLSGAPVTDPAVAAALKDVFPDQGSLPCIRSNTPPMPTENTSLALKLLPSSNLSRTMGDVENVLWEATSTPRMSAADGANDLLVVPNSPHSPKEPQSQFQRSAARGKSIAHATFPEDLTFAGEEDDDIPTVLRNSATAKFMKKTLSHFSEQQKGGHSRITLLLLDVLPAIVILLNALEIGLSNDLHPDNNVWKVLENVWIGCYTLEFIVKCHLFGFVNYFIGPDRYWNWFDGGCILSSYIELAINIMFAGESASGGVMGIMKMLRLCRLARLIRALHYSIFDELKQMVLGVVSGVRVLAWAIVLLFFCVFFIGVALRTLMGEVEEEFRTVPHAMMTTFRCYTDGCSAYNGTPLQERLFEDYGGIFFIGYGFSFMFITVGVFNLIMAIFIENVVSSSESRRLEELGKDSPIVVEKIKVVLEDLIMNDPESAELMESISNKGYEVNLNSLKDKYVITRMKFSQWLHKDLFMKLFDEAGIESATKSELFDVLDVDMGGELTIDELTTGLMRLRGPITKTDIVAVRLKVRYLTGMIEDCWRKLCPETSENGEEGSDAEKTSEVPFTFQVP
jgi:hypothetical protein